MCVPTGEDTAVDRTSSCFARVGDPKGLIVGGLRDNYLKCRGRVAHLTFTGLGVTEGN